MGITYRTEYEPSMEDSPDYTNVDPDRQSNDDLELEVTIPQMVLAGVQHQFDNGHWASLDVLWIDADQFNIGSAVVDDDGGFVLDPFQLNDTWAASVGWGMPLNDRWSIGLGALYVDDPIDDENRSTLLRVDSLWGLGASVEHTRASGMVIGGNVSVLFTGDGPVETPNLPIVGTISGEFTDRANVLFEFFVSW